jgi:23S rRNA pseudouridine1911/1915/1917 synthase
MEFPEGDPVLRRQALHAAAIGFRHPVTGRELELESAPPADFAAALELLRTGAAGRNRKG